MAHTKPIETLPSSGEHDPLIGEDQPVASGGQPSIAEDWANVGPDDPLAGNERPNPRNDPPQRDHEADRSDDPTRPKPEPPRNTHVTPRNLEARHQRSNNNANETAEVIGCMGFFSAGLTIFIGVCVSIAGMECKDHCAMLTFASAELPTNALFVLLFAAWTHAETKIFRAAGTYLVPGAVGMSLLKIFVQFLRFSSPPPS